MPADWHDRARRICREQGVDAVPHAGVLAELMSSAHQAAEQTAWSEASATGRTRGRGLSMVAVCVSGEQSPAEIAARAAETAASDYIRTVKVGVLR